MMQFGPSIRSNSIDPFTCFSFLLYRRKFTSSKVTHFIPPIKRYQFECSIIWDRTNELCSCSLTHRKTCHVAWMIRFVFTTLHVPIHRSRCIKYKNVVRIINIRFFTVREIRNNINGCAVPKFRIF